MVSIRILLHSAFTNSRCRAGITPPMPWSRGAIWTTIVPTKTTPKRRHREESHMERSSSFGYWLRRRRKALDLTQDVLAQRAGCALGTIKKLETDERRPSKQLAERLADLLQIPADERAAFLKAARSGFAADQLVIDQPSTGTLVAP